MSEKRGTRVGRTRLAGRFLLAVALATCVSFPARADDEEKKSFVVGDWAFKRLEKAHKLIAEGKLGVALKVMESMKRKLKLNDHEKALMWQTFGYVYSSREKYKQAVAAFESCLALDALPKGAALDTQFNLGQIYLANRQFSKAARTLEDWLSKVENPTPKTKQMLAIAYMQMKNFRKALHYITQAIAGVKKPRQSWLQMQLSCYFELKQKQGIARTLERLVTLYPKKSYWMQLSAVYMDMKQEEKSLAVLELVYKQGMLNKRSDLLNLASLYLHHGVPSKAARVLQKGLDDKILTKDERTVTMLADAWVRARELKRAIQPLGDAARLADKGDVYVRLAQVHLEREEWKQAAQALQAALAKGNLTDPGNTHLLLGIASFRAGRLDAARKAFQKAMQHADAKASASQWLRVIAQKK